MHIASLAFQPLAQQAPHVLLSGLTFVSVHALQLLLLLSRK